MMHLPKNRFPEHERSRRHPMPALAASLVARSNARILLAAAAFIFAGSAIAQQSYPNRPIRCISPYAPGGGNDTMARLIAQRLTERLGQQVIVDNRPGANTMIGTDIVAKARPDGHTILFSGIGTFVVNALLVRTPYDIVKDFAPVAPVAKTEMIMVVNSSVPANNLKELIALAKTKPGALNYATSSAGGSGHLAGELFKLEAGVDIVHVPYKGTSQALNDVVGGQVQISIQSVVSTVVHIRNGRLKGIAVTGDSRFSGLPQVPTFAESGLPGVEAKVLYGILAPAGTPKTIVAKLADEIAGIQRIGEFKEKLAAQGVETYVMGPEQFAALIKSDIAKNARIIKAANIKIEQ